MKTTSLPPRRAPRVTKLRALRAASLALLLGACSDEPTLLDEPLSEFPSSLAQVGIYEDLADLSRVDARAIPYAPGAELWSNGASKDRFVVLPEGTRIDATDPERWTFPVGTLLVKTFSYPLGDGVRPVETRLMRLGEDGDWDFASYRWAADGRSATRGTLRIADPVPVEAFGESFEHQIPSERQCRQCHESTARRVLGMNDRSLGAASGHDALGPLVDAGVVDLGGRAPVALPEARNADEREVIAYVWANCTHCHDGSPGTNTSFDLRPEVFLENTIDRQTASEASSDGVRVVPGDPAASVLVRAMADAEGARAMPPAGVQRRDLAAIDLLRRWIAALPATTP